MPVDLIQMETVYKIIINTFLVSIPEEIYFVLFTYIMIGEFDRWTDEDCPRLFEPWDYPRIFVPAAVAAFISNLLRYTGADLGFVSSATILVLFAGIAVVWDIFNRPGAVKWMGKVLAYLLVAFMLLAFCELLYVPMFLSVMGMTVAELNDHILFNFLLSLPERVMQCALLAYLIARKRSLLKAHLLKMVFESKLLTALTLGNLLTNVGFMVFMTRVVVHEKTLAAFPAELRFAAILVICLFPLVNLAALLGCTYFVYNRGAEQKKEVAGNVREIITQVETLSENGNQAKVIWKLMGLYTNLERVAQDLYYEENRKKKGERFDKRGGGHARGPSANNNDL